MIKTILQFVLVFGFCATFYIFSKETKTILLHLQLKQKKKMILLNCIRLHLPKKNILDSLNTLRLTYDAVILEKTALSQKLELEKKNVENLMEMIKASKNPSLPQIQIYRKQLSDLKISLI